jgi:hypothetical protein
MKGVVALAVTVVVAQIASAQSPRIRDSAGVRIIENGPRLTAPIVFQLGDKPTFDFGGLQQNPADELAARTAYPKAIRVPNGNVAIPDVTRLLVFDASGKRIKAIGRNGDGPGEFRQITDVCTTKGDTILVGQFRKPLTKLTKNGDFVGVIPLPNGMFTEGEICFDDGTFVLGNRVSGGPGTPSVYRFIRSGAAGLINPIVDHEYPMFDPLVRMQNPSAVRRENMYFANGNSFDIKVYDRGGKLRQIIRSADRLRPLTDADKAQMRPMAYRAGSTPAEIEDAQRRAIANSTTKFWPTVDKMMTDLNGRVWVEDWAQQEEPTEPRGWAAFDSTGKLLGRMLIPGSPSLEQRRLVVSFGDNEVFFARFDADGARHYTAYPIVPIKR